MRLDDLGDLMYEVDLDSICCHVSRNIIQYFIGEHVAYAKVDSEVRCC